ncbi:NADH dehydrogenase (ubiquinone) complex I [Striga asiatica]|uniref:NADH dehydrogenase (Ubiquinone) complex I n=1 Tax=Striga asiatica TaxID=4170 RepID=A0A5A7P8S9_STRAF|nr:NADH dehydrogenase (ubiquinone) complex I [Striga asiatica]
MSNARTAFSYCVQQVRNYDYHHYLCLLELPLNMRRSAFALRAFNVETARAMDVASDPRIGLMRLLWWQEAIDKIFSNKLVEHPVAQALASVISEHKFSKSWLKRSVQARIDDARRDVSNIPETIEDLERYAEDTMSTILYSTLEADGFILSPKAKANNSETDGIRSTAADHAASHIGKASGLALLLRSLPYHAGRNRHFLYIPADVAKKHGLLVNKSENRIDSREGLCSAVYEMASVANAHLQKARELAETVPVGARPVMLPAVPTQFVLDTLRRVQFDVFDPRLARGILGITGTNLEEQLKMLAGILFEKMACKQNQ